jgi:hypothetical protein
MRRCVSRQEQLDAGDTPGYSDHFVRGVSVGNPAIRFTIHTSNGSRTAIAIHITSGDM